MAGKPRSAGHAFREEPMDITTVLLDAGGVILDESEHETVRAQVIVETLVDAVPGYSLEDYYGDVAEAVQSFCPKTYAYVFWKHLEPDRRRFDEVYARHLAVWRERRPPLKLMAGLAEEVRALADHFALGIAGQYGREVVDLLDEHDLLDCFAHRFTQDDFAVTKPDPRCYEQMAQRMRVDPRSCVMVGDRIDKDVIPARQIGMKTIRIRVGLHRNQEPRVPDEMPDAELAGVAGLAAAVGSMAHG